MFGDFCNNKSTYPHVSAQSRRLPEILGDFRKNKAGPSAGFRGEPFSSRPPPEISVEHRSPYAVLKYLRRYCGLSFLQR